MLITAGLVGIYFWMPTHITRAYGVGASAASSLTGDVSVAGGFYRPTSVGRAASTVMSLDGSATGAPS